MGSSLSLGWAARFLRVSRKLTIMSTGELVMEDGASFARASTAVTATDDGLTTGVVADGTHFVVVTSGNSAHIVTLPAPTIGREVWFRNAGTGYNLASSAPATVAINGGTGASAKSAIGANVTTHCICTTATAWVCTDYATAGTVTATAVAS